MKDEAKKKFTDYVDRLKKGDPGDVQAVCSAVMSSLLNREITTKEADSLIRAASRRIKELASQYAGREMTHKA